MKKTGKFSDAQWMFLSVMNLFESPVSIDVLTTLIPLSLSELFDLLERGNRIRIIKEFESRIYSIEKELPSNIKKRIEQSYTEENIFNLLQQIESMNLLDRLSPPIYADFLARSGKDTEATQVMIRSAMEALESGHPEIAHNYLKQVLLKLSNHLVVTKNVQIFIDLAIEFSKLCILLGIDFIDSAKFMEQVKVSSEILGNRRAWALANLHLGYFYNLLSERTKALELFSIGQAAVEALADQDILDESSEFIGAYFFIQGKYKQAIDLIERAESYAKLSGKGLSISGFIVKSYGLIYLGHYYLSIGFISSEWRKAHRSEQHATANLLQAILGTVSVLINQYEEAVLHLNSCLKQSDKVGLRQARYIAMGGLAFLNYRKKNYKQAYLMMVEMLEEGRKYGISESFTSPWFMEMLVDFEKLGYPNIPGMEPVTQMQRIMKEPNRHLQGVALRLLAMRAFSEGKEDQIVWGDLKRSEELLQEVGDPIQLAKTHIDMAILKLQGREKEDAYRLVNEARYVLIEHGEDFPDGLHPLLEENDMFEKSEKIQEEADEAFYAMISELPLSPHFERGLETILMACNRFFGAEQGAICWTDDGTAKNLFIRISYNIGPYDTGSQWFVNNMRFIKQAFEEKQPIKKHEQIISSRTKTDSRVGSILCLPFHTANGASGVFWHGNSYMEDCFSLLHKRHLVKICDYLTTYISSIFEFNRQIELAKESTIKKAAQIDSFTKQQFIIRGIAMTQVINQARVIAEADGTVLILGETGVGKELLARWIHKNSKRKNWPIVTIDCTTIPETLIESALFGYEKGSFTGADRKTIGQIELADKGTLFIDEIGETPLNIQVKLLRLLQEKKFKRIGGHRLIASDFRLIAATNRNLLKEVENGRFRNDLYYRLNVFPITIPPLRNRKDEIIDIAEEFINRYGKRYNRSNLSLSKEHCRQLIDYEWPGNVRELENIIERSVLMSANSNLNLLLPLNDKKADHFFFADNLKLDEIQRRYICHILEKSGGKISGPGGATEILGIKRTTLYQRMKKLGLR